MIFSSTLIVLLCVIALQSSILEATSASLEHDTTAIQALQTSKSTTKVENKLRGQTTGLRIKENPEGLTEKSIIEEFDKIMGQKKLLKKDQDRLDYLISLNDLSQHEMETELEAHEQFMKTQGVGSHNTTLQYAPYCGSGGFNDIYGNCVYATYDYAQESQYATRRWYSNQCSASQWTGYHALSFASKYGCRAVSTFCGKFRPICSYGCKQLYAIAVKNYCNGNVNSFFDTSHRTCGSLWCCNWRWARGC
jgi:hypothetical protein